MGVSREVELKLVFDPADRDRLCAAAPFSAFAAPTRQQLAATYFDTPDEALRGAGFSLRLRREDERQVQTIKAAGCAAGLFVRPEWERVVEGDAPVLDPVDDPLHAVLDPAPLEGLVPLFHTVVLREKRVVSWEDARLEIAIDSGELIAGDGRETLCELELELLSGDAGALFVVARALDTVVPLRLSVLSKSERGYRLAGGPQGGAVKAEPVELADTPDVATAFARIAQGCIRQFRLNEDLFLASGSPDSLHQLRVGIRRLRSALTLFRPVLRADPEYRRISDALKELGTVMGAVRDLDVLIARLAPAERDRLIAAREEAREKAAMTLELAQTRHLMLDLAQWLALGSWRKQAEEGGWADRPPADFAAHALRRCRKRLKQAGRNWATLDAARRHQVRKEAKKLRYATEFFASLFSSGKRNERRIAFRDALEEVQDELGALNDLAVAPELLARFGMADGLVSPPPPRQRAMIDSAGRKLAALLDTRRFWD